MNKEKNYTCPLTGLPVSLVLSGVLLIGGAVLGTCLYSKVSTITKQVNDLHALMINSQFGSESSFRNFMDIMIHEKVLKVTEEQTKERIEAIKEQFDLQAEETNT